MTSTTQHQAARWVWSEALSATSQAGNSTCFRRLVCLLSALCPAAAALLWAATVPLQLGYTLRSGTSCVCVCTHTATHCVLVMVQLVSLGVGGVVLVDWSKTGAFITTAQRPGKGPDGQQAKNVKVCTHTIGPASPFAVCG